MAAASSSATVTEPVLHGIDRMVRNIETGRFERSLSALTAVGALVTAAEIFFEHDSASFGNKLMWLPVALGPVGAAAGVAGVFSHRMAKTALPIASADDHRQRPAGHLPARARDRPEAGRLAQRPLQHGDGAAAAGARCWSPWSAGWACWPRSCGARSEPDRARASAAAGPGRSLPRLRRARPEQALGPGDHRRRARPDRDATRHPLLHPRRAGHRHGAVRPAARTSTDEPSRVPVPS